MLHEVLAGRVGPSYLVLEVWGPGGMEEVPRPRPDDCVIVATRYDPITGRLQSHPFARPYPPDRAAGVMARARVMFGGAA